MIVEGYLLNCKGVTKLSDLLNHIKSGNPDINVKELTKLCKRLMVKFETYGSVKDRRLGNSGKKPLDGTICDEIIAKTANIRHQSSKMTANQLNISDTTVRRKLKASGFHPYKYAKAQGKLQLTRVMIFHGQITNL